MCEKKQNFIPNTGTPVDEVMFLLMCSLYLLTDKQELHLTVNQTKTRDAQFADHISFNVNSQTISEQ